MFSINILRCTSFRFTYVYFPRARVCVCVQHLMMRAEAIYYELNKNFCFLRKANLKHLRRNENLTLLSHCFLFCWSGLNFYADFDGNLVSSLFRQSSASYLPNFPDSKVFILVRPLSLTLSARGKRILGLFQMWAWKICKLC